MTDEASTTRTILLIGSGPIQIGQAAEFDYSGAQACRALQEEGARVVLVNSNPATIMTDPEMADKVYIEPITTEAIAEIIRKERPDGVIAGLGGQTGLNVTAELAEEGVLEAHDVEIMGTPLETIYATEDREQSRHRMEEIGQPVARSRTIESMGEIEGAVEAVGGLPVIMRTTYTLGGSGSGVVSEMDELKESVRKGLRLSRNGEVLITESIAGWVELEYEVMRDAADSCIIMCNMENIDPMGIHTGESTVVTPSQVIPDDGHQEMRTAALDVIRDLGIQGGCNIQFAWRDDGTPGGEYRVVEVNPRVSRSSALASKATGYPIARVTAKVALGKRLHEIENEITGETTAAFEPAIDYVVTKVPRWPKDKFDDVAFDLGTAMKSTGEAMSIGRTFEESLLKALRSTEYDPDVEWGALSDTELEAEYLETPTPDRPYAMFEAFSRGYSLSAVCELTGIQPWYVERYENIALAASAAQEGDFTGAAEVGFTNAQVAAGIDASEASTVPQADGGTASIDAVEASVPDRDFKQVDTCAGEFAASTPYYYSARARGDRLGRDEVQVDTGVESVVIVGGGPIRIGQGVEFDYCTVHAVRALRENGIEAHVVNNNPETVSTDYDTSDGLFFEPITAEEIADVIEATGADGAMIQFGGQTSVDIGEPLEEEIARRGLDCEIMGTTVDAMDLAEDRNRFNLLMDELGIAQPEGGTARSEDEALDLAHGIGYPVLVRPSYVLGGRAMEVVHSDSELKEYIEEAVRVSPEKPILVDKFLEDAVELDVDAVSAGERVLIGGVMEHVETAGVHSGDSACMIPPRWLEQEAMGRIREVTEEIARARYGRTAQRPTRRLRGRGLRARGQSTLLADRAVRLESDRSTDREDRRAGNGGGLDQRPRRTGKDPRAGKRQGGRVALRPAARLGSASGPRDEVDGGSDGYRRFLRKGLLEGPAGGGCGVTRGRDRRDRSLRGWLRGVLRRSGVRGRSRGDPRGAGRSGDNARSGGPPDGRRGGRDLLLDGPERAGGPRSPPRARGTPRRAGGFRTSRS